MGRLHPYLPSSQHAQNLTLGQTYVRLVQLMTRAVKFLTHTFPPTPCSPSMWAGQMEGTKVEVGWAGFMSLWLYSKSFWFRTTQILEKAITNHFQFSLPCPPYRVVPPRFSWYHCSLTVCTLYFFSRRDLAKAMFTELCSKHVALKMPLVTCSIVDSPPALFYCHILKVLHLPGSFPPLCCSLQFCCLSFLHHIFNVRIPGAPCQGHFSLQKIALCISHTKSTSDSQTNLKPRLQF